MPALDFTTFPSKPTAPPAGSPGAPRPTARAGAPAAGPKTGSKAGSPKAAGEFGQLVDRLADAPDEGPVPSRGAKARGSRDSGPIGEESAAEPRAKGDADGASGTANDAPAAVASMASNPAPFPWTLPLSPSLWLIEQVKDPADNGGGDTYHGEEGDGVTGAITESIANAGAGACLATLPGAETSEHTLFNVPVDAPIAIDPATTIGAASTTPATGTQGAQAASDVSGAIETAAWTDAAAASPVAFDAAADANATGAGDDLLAINGLTGAAALATAAAANGQFGSGEATTGQSAVDALANNPLASRASIISTDSTRLAPSAMDSATTAAAVDDTAATTAAGQNGQANAALDAPLSGDSAREQALIELQRALESASANASSATAKPHARNADATMVIQTGASAGAATDDRGGRGECGGDRRSRECRRRRPARSARRRACPAPIRLSHPHPPRAAPADRVTPDRFPKSSTPTAP